MDRRSFLSSLPFLIPLQSTAWPPTWHGSRGRVLLGAKEYHNLLARTFVLSIELPLPQQEQTDEQKEHQPSMIHRPVFFSTMNRAEMSSSPMRLNDPSLSILELAVLTVKSNDKTEATLEGADQVVCIRIQEQAVFLLDMNQCLHLELIPLTTVHGQKDHTLPCHLQMQFPNGTWRIFSMNDATSSSSAATDDADVTALLQPVLATLRPLLLGGVNASSHKRSRPLAVPTRDICKAYRLCDSSPRSSPSTTPAGSSSTTTAASPTRSSSKRTRVSLVQQPPTTLQQPTASTAATLTNEEEEATEDDDAAFSEPRRTLQRHWQVYTQSLSQMETVGRLVAPLSDDHSPSSSAAATLELVPQLMNAATQALSQSYLSAADREHLDATDQARRQAHQAALDTWLSSFFPSVPPAQRRGVRRASPAETRPPPDAEWAAQGARLLQEQKRRLQEHTQLLLLPSRG